MNIVVFENEYQNIRSAFMAVNLIHFNKRLVIKNYSASQDCKNLLSISKDSCIFVDIDLSSKSIMDGFELITELLRLGFSKENIIILTGHINIEGKAKARGLGDISILTKPIEFTMLHKVLNLHLNRIQNTG